jgi:hypothetical protein
LSGVNAAVDTLEALGVITVDRPGRDFAVAMHDLAEEVHRYLVEFAGAHSRCNCDKRESATNP